MQTFGLTVYLSIRRRFPCGLQKVAWYIRTMKKQADDHVAIDRTQTGVRIEKRLLKVLKALAELKELSLGDLLEGIVLQNLKSAHGDDAARVVPLVSGSLGFLIMNTNSLAATTRVHTAETFYFSVAAPMAIAFPLFGANRERLWAPDWEPVFIWPPEPDDRSGTVFTVAHGERLATWVNTDFDPIAGLIRYVYVLPEVRTTVITLRLRERHAATDVQVRYERTSLNETADERVRELARQDAVAGPEWASQIENYLTRRPAR